MGERVMMTEDEVNTLVERRLRAFMVDWLYELDAIGMGHVPIACDMRECIDGDALAEPAHNRRAGDRPYLRVVRSGEAS